MLLKRNQMLTTTLALLSIASFILQTHAYPSSEVNPLHGIGEDDTGPTLSSSRRSSDAERAAFTINGKFVSYPISSSFGAFRLGSMQFIKEFRILQNPSKYGCFFWTAGAASPDDNHDPALPSVHGPTYQPNFVSETRYSDDVAGFTSASTSAEPHLGFGKSNLLTCFKLEKSQKPADVIGLWVETSDADADTDADAAALSPKGAQPNPVHPTKRKYSVRMEPVHDFISSGGRAAFNLQGATVERVAVVHAIRRDTVCRIVGKNANGRFYNVDFSMARGATGPFSYVAEILCFEELSSSGW